MLKPTPIAINPEAQRRRRGRNWALAGSLLAFVVIVFIVTIVKLKAASG